MKRDEFIWAVRRIAGDRPPKELVTALRNLLRDTYGVGFLTDVSIVQQVACLVDVVRVAREFEIRRLEQRRDSIVAGLSSPGMLLAQ